MSLREVTDQLRMNNQTEEREADSIEEMLEILREERNEKAVANSQGEATGMNSVVRVGDVKLEDLAELNESIITELQKMNKLQLELIAAIKGQPLAELEKERETGKPSLMRRMMNYGASDMINRRFSGAQPDQGGGVTGFLRAGLVGTAVGGGIAAGLSTAGILASSLAMKAGIAGLAVLYMDDVSEFIQNIGGSKDLGDVGSWTSTTGIVIGSLFGPKAGIIAALATFVAGMAFKTASFIREKVKENEAAMASKLEAEWQKAKAMGDNVKADEALIKLARETARSMQTTVAPPKEDIVRRQNVLKDEIEEAKVQGDQARLRVLQKENETYIQARSQLGDEFKAEDIRQRLLDKIAVAPTDEDKVDLLYSERNPHRVASASHDRFEHIRMELLNELQGEYEERSKILDYVEDEVIPWVKGLGGDQHPSLPTKDQGRVLPDDGDVQVIKGSVYDFRSEDELMGMKFGTHPSYYNLPDIARPIPESTRNSIQEMLNRNREIEENRIAPVSGIRQLAPNLIAQNDGGSNSTIVTDAKTINNHYGSNGGQGSSEQMVPIANKNPAFG